MAVLVESFATEPSDPARARLVQVFALYNVPISSQKVRDTLLLKALLDPYDGVVQAAAFGVGTQQVIAFVPNVVKLLSHDNAAVRIASIQAIASFGSRALPYIEQLRQALASESDPIARKSLEAAISKISRAP